jgi:uncharacterized membrane protein
LLAEGLFPPMTASKHSNQTFRQFFLRGLGIVLPTILTIWILVAVYQFVDQKIADPINRGTRWLVVRASPWPAATDDDYSFIAAQLVNNQIENPEIAAQWRRYRTSIAPRLGPNPDPEVMLNEARQFVRAELPLAARQHRLNVLWNKVRIGDWAVLDLIGLLVAVLLIYAIGRMAGGFIGRRLYSVGESWLRRVPGFKHVYPYVKQVTDFFVGDETERLQFNNVVAVQYPRKGIWSIGLVTGDTLQRVQEAAKQECMTVFIPSSPTPFTGYVITVPVEDVVDLPITIDDALRFCVSGGVIVPENQVIRRDEPLQQPTSPPIEKTTPEPTAPPS